MNKIILISRFDQFQLRHLGNPEITWRIRGGKGEYVCLFCDVSHFDGYLDDMSVATGYMSMEWASWVMVTGHGVIVL